MRQALRKWAWRIDGIVSIPGSNGNFVGAVIVAFHSVIKSKLCIPDRQHMHTEFQYVMRLLVWRCSQSTCRRQSWRRLHWAQPRICTDAGTHHAPCTHMHHTCTPRTHAMHARTAARTTRTQRVCDRTGSFLHRRRVCRSRGGLARSHHKSPCVRQCSAVQQ